MNYDINAIVRLLNQISKEIINILNESPSQSSLKYIIQTCLSNGNLSVRDKYYVYSPETESDKTTVKVEFYFAGRNTPISICFETDLVGCTRAKIDGIPIVITEQMDLCIDGIIYSNCINYNSILYIDSISNESINNDVVQWVDPMEIDEKVLEFSSVVYNTYKNFFNALSLEEQEKIKILDINLLNLANEVSVEYPFLNQLLSDNAERCNDNEQFTHVVYGLSFMTRKESYSQCVAVLDTLIRLSEKYNIPILSFKDYLNEPKSTICIEKVIDTIDDYYTFSSNTKEKELTLSQFRLDYGINKEKVF